MKMEAACAPETSVFTHKTRMCRKPEDNLKYINWLLGVYYRLCDREMLKSNQTWFGHLYFGKWRWASQWLRHYIVYVFPYVVILIMIFNQHIFCLYMFFHTCLTSTIVVSLFSHMFYFCRGTLEGKQQKPEYDKLLSNPMLKFSGLYQNGFADLMVVCQVFSDGHPLTLPVSTSYKAFTTRWK